jgi:hypothetical protein
MEAKLDVNSNKLIPKFIDNEIVQQSVQFNKEMLRKLNERALNRAFQLDRNRT